MTIRYIFKLFIYWEYFFFRWNHKTNPKPWNKIRQNEQGKQKLPNTYHDRIFVLEQYTIHHKPPKDNIFSIPLLRFFIYLFFSNKNKNFGRPKI